MRFPNLIIFASLTYAATVPRTRYTMSSSKSVFGNILSTCPSGYEVCEFSCSHIGENCCNDGTGESCSAGYYCIPDACCPEGEICTSETSQGPCVSPKVPCGDGCMPATGTCCSSEKYYCPDFGICTTDGTCCDLGTECEDSDSSLAPSPTFGSTSISSPVSSVNSNSGPSSAASEPTSTKYESISPASLTVAAETTSSGFGFGFTDAAVSGSSKSDGSAQTAQHSVTVTVTATPSATAASNAVPTISSIASQADSYRTANGRIVAGFAVVAGLLVQQL
ncbi:hypothetical protein F5Y09DRAFT_356989 [Xylaria sp. FL1042]|nr:hypothetical protein F5Y09DRAFT_356989 [Xylaria sp. FL1042]